MTDDPTMPLQNRVTLLGEIVADPARGLCIGNRGIIHDPTTRTLLRRRWSSRAWIVCALRYKDHHREVMAPGTWTELFFLDEVTALAAGHRPCFFCRRADATRFVKAACDSGGVEAPRAPAVDAVLHGQRAAAGAVLPCIDGEQLEGLPDAVAVEAAGTLYVTRGDELLPWSASGYGAAVPRAALAGQRAVRVITPALTRGALGAGYRPGWHPSAEAVPVRAADGRRRDG